MRTLTGQNNTIMLSTFQATALFNSTATAIAFTTTTAAVDSTDTVYLTDILTSLAGVKLVTATTTSAAVTSSSLELLQRFVMQFSQIYALPSIHAVTFWRSVICVHCLLWFAFYVTAIVLWRVYPAWLITTTSSNSNNYNSISSNNDSSPMNASITTNSAKSKSE